MSLDELKKSNRPGHSTTSDGSLGSSDYDSATCTQDMDKFRKLAFEVLELNSSECSSGPTSEFTQQPSGSNSECRRTTQDNIDSSSDARQTKTNDNGNRGTERKR